MTTSGSSIEANSQRHLVALLAVYGMLVIGMMLMCLRVLISGRPWKDGYWFARSSEFMQTDLMQTLRWMRVPGDTTQHLFRNLTFFQSPSQGTKTC